MKDVDGNSDTTCFQIMSHILNKCDTIYCSDEALEEIPRQVE